HSLSTPFFREKWKIAASVFRPKPHTMYSTGNAPEKQQQSALFEKILQKSDKMVTKSEKQTLIVKWEKRRENVGCGASLYRIYAAGL
ncbi:MAG: hypothetical protein K1W40_05880, partial [Schaedlerella sp.]|uniref:hypothetical protein n=1 Tax=Schaedlerella sp. TaxID=2676057 RepID=UPI003528A2E0